MGDLSLRISQDARDVLLPMHLRLSLDGRILHAGPTVHKLVGSQSLAQEAFLDIFEVRRPAGLDSVRELGGRTACRLHLHFRRPPRTSFKAISVADALGQELLVNLSFGISLVDAIRDYELTSSDFAYTDLAIEMLYIAEAKQTILDEWRSLNNRLQSAKVAAEVQAHTDTLTGLKNRRAMDQALKQLCAGREPFGLINLDLDFFKEVNDTLGHAAGDHVLQTAAKAMTDATRAGDTLVRAGGDEFVLILPGLVRADTLVDLAKRLIARLGEPIVYGGEVCRISGSAGIAVNPGTPPLSPDTMLERADRALYASKEAGRGCVTVFSPDLPGVAREEE